MVTKFLTVAWFLVYGVAAFWGFPSATFILGVLALGVAVAMIAGL